MKTASTCPQVQLSTEPFWSMNSFPEYHPVWLKLANGQLPGFMPRQLSLQLLFTRLKHEKITATDKARMLHAFFVKYEKILSQEIAQFGHP
jgi:hypothetical protein